MISMMPNCKICNSAIAGQIESKDSRVFDYCKVCDFIALQPEFFLDAKAEKARYELHENTIDDQGYVDMFEKFIDYAIKPYAVSKILDYGSGPGPVLAELLERHGYEADIYDPFFAARDLQDSSYDLICSTEVFEHFNNPLETIINVIKLLKPGGYLAVMTMMSPAVESFSGWWYKNDPTHVSFYTAKTFEYIAEKLALRLEKHNQKNILVLKKL